jgi:hypothetical protein
MVAANRQQFGPFSDAHEDEHRNGQQRSIDCPARTRSFIRSQRMTDCAVNRRFPTADKHSLPYSG